MSTIAVSLGYLHRRPLPYLDYSNWGKGFTGSYIILLILNS